VERDPKRAASLYEAALRMDPAKPAALVNLGVLTHEQDGMQMPRSFGNVRWRRMLRLSNRC